MGKETVSPEPKKLLINRNGLKVLRVVLSKDGSIPEHSVNADVVVVVLKGEGIFYINKNPHPIVQGDVFDLVPGTPHAINATNDLELIVTIVHLKSE